ncbi:MAG: HD domain-containing protein [Candidatus Izemoplasmatales bacterium]
MSHKNEFIDVYNQYIKREGAKELLEFLLSSKSDFFEAPCSTRYHLSKEGGLVEHSLNVYHCLKDYLERPRVKTLYNLEVNPESIAIVALLHDLCKINVYKKSFRNTKDESGKWIKVPTYEFQDDLPYGHGEKSVYIISGFMKLTRDEAFAIRYHMGFSDTENIRNVGEAFSKFPLAFALSTADMEATYFIEN